MKAIIYFSLSKKKNSKRIAKEIQGDHFEIENLGKKIKFAPFQMFYYGYLMATKKPLEFNSPKIDFDKYDEVVLISPVWGGKVNIFMKQYLDENIFKNKKVTIIGTCMGNNKKYFESFDTVIDKSNKVIEHKLYTKRSMIYEKKV